MGRGGSNLMTALIGEVIAKCSLRVPSANTQRLLRVGKLGVEGVFRAKAPPNPPHKGEGLT
jgi:hypothetical protein